MKRREGHKGYVIVARSHKLKGGIQAGRQKIDEGF
jgi:hypothetical protein